eukprot:5834688-Pleurochrysis_carterae.AAC.1
MHTRGPLRACGLVEEGWHLHESAATPRALGARCARGRCAYERAYCRNGARKSRRGVAHGAAIAQ